MNQNQSKLYKCPCGKAYQSYPALHTHIRTKHNRQAPGTIQTPNTKMTKRGRPAVQMHKVPQKDKISQIQSIICIQLGILRIQDRYEQNILLNGNEQYEIDLSGLNKYKRSGIYEGIIIFIGLFCMHFRKELNNKIVQFMQLLLIWVEREKEDFEFELINEFMSNGWQKTALDEQMAYQYGQLNTFKIILVSMSQWLYVNGYTTEILQQIQ